ncbi:MAG: hypothetical protein NTW86_07760 [Candidatus Sumerlaeota bacterium]|nr:hypothetical protein [Candidatus Sumerlaeota bacterium]
MIAVRWIRRVATAGFLGAVLCVIGAPLAKKPEGARPLARPPLAPGQKAPLGPGGKAPLPAGERKLPRPENFRPEEDEHPAPEEAKARAAAAKGKPFSIRVFFGATEKARDDWSGGYETESVAIENAWPYGLMPEGAMQGKAAWKVDASKKPAFFSAVDMQCPALELQGRAQEGGILRFTTKQGNFEVEPLKVGFGQSAQFLEGEVRVEGMPYSDDLGDEFSESDNPAIAVSPKGAAYAAWMAWVGDRDEIRLALYNNERRDWNTFSRAPNTSGDVWMPRLAFDGEEKLWLVWCQQVQRNFDLYARSFDGKEWGKEYRLTDQPTPDINPSVAADGQGGFYVAWQAFRRPMSDVYLIHFDGKEFGKPVQVSDNDANEWYPNVAADKNGAAWVGYDSYRNGSYNVYLRKVEGGKAGEELTVADSPFYETDASVLCAPDGRVYVAYEQGPINWTKPQGRTAPVKYGTGIQSPRDCMIRCLEDGQWKMPSVEVKTCLGPVPISLQRPRLAMDGQGRLWVRFRHRVDSRPAQPGPRAKSRSCWEECATYWKGDGWAEAIPLTHSYGRISMFGDTAAGQNGIWTIWPTDNRLILVNPHVPMHQHVWAGQLEAQGDDAPVQLVPARAPEIAPEVKLWNQDKENQDIAAIRGYTTQINGAEHKIYRGDLHRHTELSWDGGGVGDGSILEFYRYMLDSVDMDFGAITDHQGGGERPYNWWMTQKTADLYHTPREFIPLYGYERSATYPNGHRNVFHTERGIPVTQFFTNPTFNGERPGIGSGDLLADDTKLLYKDVHDTNGIAISHTSATRMGTDWRDNDPEVEPVVEIFQGCRTSYEYEGAPRADKPPKQGEASRSGYQPLGFVWNAWAKGYRLGVITSSDHGSTHMSYAMVYSPADSREGIVDSIRKRQTYGATANIILDVRSQGGFMGSDYQSAEPPTFQVKAIGTSNIAQVDIIKDATFAYQAQPNERQIDFSYTDSDFGPGAHYYYVRLIQDDKEMAWGSPTWVTKK